MARIGNPLQHVNQRAARQGRGVKICLQHLRRFLGINRAASSRAPRPCAPPTAPRRERSRPPLGSLRIRAACDRDPHQLRVRRQTSRWPPLSGRKHRHRRRQPHRDTSNGQLPDRRMHTAVAIHVTPVRAQTRSQLQRNAQALGRTSTSGMGTVRDQLESPSLGNTSDRVTYRRRLARSRRGDQRRPPQPLAAIDESQNARRCDRKGAAGPPPRSTIRMGALRASLRQGRLVPLSASPVEPGRLAGLGQQHVSPGCVVFIGFPWNPCVVTSPRWSDINRR